MQPVLLFYEIILLLHFFRNVGEELADEGDQVGAAVATAQTKIISQVSPLVQQYSSYTNRVQNGIHFCFLDCEEEHDRKHCSNSDIGEAPV